MTNAKGRPVEGIAAPITTSKINSVANKPTPAPRIVTIPQAIITPAFRDDNPTLKNFPGAVYANPEQALPVRAFGPRMVTRGSVGGDDCRGMSQMSAPQNDGIKARRTSPAATVRTYR